MAQQPSNDDVRRLYDHMEDRRKSFMTAQWDTLRYFTTLFSAVFSVVIGSMVAYYGFYDGLNRTAIWISGRISVGSLLLVFSFFLVILLVLGLLNMRRETRRLLETITVIVKAEKHLGLHYEFPSNTLHFPQDRYLVPERWLGSGRPLARDMNWVDNNMRWLDWPWRTGLASFSAIFYCLIVFTMILMLVVFRWMIALPIYDC